MKNGIVATRHFNEIAIGQRADGYLNATAMCRANGKDWNDYRVNKATDEFISVLSSSAGIPGDELVVVKTKVRNEDRGTWVHPKIAYHLAMWCNAQFAVAVMGWIDDIRTKGYATAPGVTIPPVQVIKFATAKSEFRACRDMAKDFGMDNNQATLAAIKAVRKRYGINLAEDLDATHLLAPQQEAHLTVTDIGARLTPSLSAIAANALLEENGFQTGRRDAQDRTYWEPTEKGRSYAVWLDTGKAHGDGTPIRQLRWSADIVTSLKTEEVLSC